MEKAIVVMMSLALMCGAVEFCETVRDVRRFGSIDVDGFRHFSPPRTAPAPEGRSERSERETLCPAEGLPERPARQPREESWGWVSLVLGLACVLSSFLSTVLGWTGKSDLQVGENLIILALVLETSEAYEVFETWTGSNLPLSIAMLAILPAGVFAKFFWLSKRADEQAKQLWDQDCALRKLRLSLLIKCLGILLAEPWAIIARAVPALRLFALLLPALHCLDSALHGQSNRLFAPAVWGAYFGQLCFALKCLLPSCPILAGALIVFTAALAGFAAYQAKHGADFMFPESEKKSFCYCKAPQSPDTECSICLEPVGKDAWTPPCSHAFHKQCLLPWLEEKSACPCCRIVLPPVRIH